MKYSSFLQKEAFVWNAFAGIVITMFLACCIHSSSLIAQNYRPHKSPIHYSAQLGVGVGAPGYTATSSLNVIANNNLFAFRVVRAGEISVFGGGVNENLWEIALLYGRMIRTKKSLMGGALGLASIQGVRQGGLLYKGWFGNVYEAVPFRHMGLAMEGQFFWMPRPHFGLGLIPQININRSLPYFGILLGIRVGQMHY